MSLGSYSETRVGHGLISLQVPSSDLLAFAEFSRLVPKAAANAQRRAINKTLGWLRTHIAREVGRKEGIAMRAVRQRLRAYSVKGASTKGKLWFGLNALEASRTGRARQTTSGVNVGACLDMLAWSELGSDYLRLSDDGYNVIVTGIDGKLELFDDYSTHPFENGRKSKVINGRGLTSNACGRYQFMLKDWPHYRDLLHLPDLGPASQDRWAVRLIKERRALEDVIGGRIADAISKCRNIWASLPGAGYNQREHRLEDLLARYEAAGGSLA
jgi:muramidase (phage lysozyme)